MLASGSPSSASRSHVRRCAAPAPEALTGAGVGGLEFTAGVAYTDDRSVIDYCRRAGYRVEPAPQGATPSQRDVLPADGVRQVGARARDAAVDPRPGDFLAPVNAGRAGRLGNPHGSTVVALQALTPRSQVPPYVAGAQVPMTVLDRLSDGEVVSTARDAHVTTS